MKKVLILGGTGFLGRHLYKEFINHNYIPISVGTSDANLINKNEVHQLYRRHNPNIIANLAANVGGIGKNNCLPADLMYENLLINTNVIEAANQLDNLEKFIQIGTVCSYGHKPSIPFKEEYLFTEYPSEENSYYGMSKLVMLPLLWAYRKQYGLNGIYLLPSNLYGPEDSLDPLNNHVIPALILKFLKAKKNNEPKVEIWGTGKPTREFLYVEDAAEAIVMAAEKYDEPEPVNIGNGFEISIEEIAVMIAVKVDYDGEIVFNPDMPDGQPRRCLDVSRAKEKFGFVAKTPLIVGLDKTIEWIKNQI